MGNITDKQITLDSRYLRMAQIWAENSYCRRRQVGANICEDDDDHTKAYVLHAEANAITKVAQSNNSSLDATLYVTTSPCIECSKLIIQAGIKRVVFGEYYRMTDGVQLLCRAGIECIHLVQNGDTFTPHIISRDE